MADAGRHIAPRLDSWHQLPKTIRPICSPRRLTSSGSVALRKRSARPKNSCCLRFSASIPFSMSSSIIRLALSLRALAKLRTCVATFAGKLLLCRTVLFAVLMPPLCTKLVRLRKRGADRQAAGHAGVRAYTDIVVFQLGSQKGRCQPQGHSGLVEPRFLTCNTPRTKVL